MAPPTASVSIDMVISSGKFSCGGRISGRERVWIVEERVPLTRRDTAIPGIRVSHLPPIPGLDGTSGRAPRTFERSRDRRTRRPAHRVTPAPPPDRPPLDTPSPPPRRPWPHHRPNHRAPDPARQQHRPHTWPIPYDLDRVPALPSRCSVRLPHHRHRVPPPLLRPVHHPRLNPRSDLQDRGLESIQDTGPGSGRQLRRTGPSQHHHAASDQMRRTHPQIPKPSPDQARQSFRSSQGVDGPHLLYADERSSLAGASGLARGADQQQLILASRSRCSRTARAVR